MSQDFAYSEHSPEQSRAVKIDDPLRLFNDFYREIVWVKRQLENSNLESEVGRALNVSRRVTGEEIAEFISQRLRRWLEKKRRQSQKLLVDSAHQGIEQALFMATALADEIFLLELDWPGRDHWCHFLLEESLFHTSYAGEAVFTQVVQRLNQRVLEPQEQRLLAVYFLAIRLGFAGKYRDQPKKLHYLQQKIYKRMRGGMDEDAAGKICWQAYEHLLLSMQEKRLAPLSRWWRTMAATAVFYLVLSSLIWVGIKGNWMIMW